MSNSVQAVKDKLKNVSREKNADFNSVMRFYMYDRFVERLSKSKYKDNFILKGGFYLSKLFGLDNRCTMDIDTAIRKAEFTEENIIKMINEIINIDVGDNVKFKIEKTETILSKLETSSRMKDYYDIYLIYKFKFDKIDKEKFRGAVEKTFKKREFDADLITNLNIIKESKVLKDKWISYSRKYSYARDVEFEETLKCLEQFINIIVSVAV